MRLPHEQFTVIITLSFCKEHKLGSSPDFNDRYEVTLVAVGSVSVDSCDGRVRVSSGVIINRDTGECIQDVRLIFVRILQRTPPRLPILYDSRQPIDVDLPVRRQRVYDATTQWYFALLFHVLLEG